MNITRRDYKTNNDPCLLEADALVDKILPTADVDLLKLAFYVDENEHAENDREGEFTQCEDFTHGLLSVAENMIRGIQNQGEKYNRGDTNPNATLEEIFNDSNAFRAIPNLHRYQCMLYVHFAEADLPRKVIENLINITQGTPFKTNPPLHACHTYPKSYSPALASATKPHAPAIATAILEGFDNNLRNAFAHSNFTIGKIGRNPNTKLTANNVQHVIPNGQNSKLAPISATDLEQKLRAAIKPTYIALRIRHRILVNDYWECHQDKIRTYSCPNSGAGGVYEYKVIPSP